ncbi:MAG: HAMP domain-containing sensor histidine kinase [Anaerolineae bacterium]
MENAGNILVIDDEPGIRRACQRALEPRGFTVETAATIREGLGKIQTGNFDLVLLDVMMPDGRGIDLLSPIQEQDPDLIVIIITGYATVELAVKAIKQGAYDFISKPFTSDLLLMTVNQGLEKRRLSLEARRLQAIEQEAARLAHAKEEMERLDRFKSAFMLMVAHELRAPVGGAQSLLRTLLRGLAGGLNDQQRDILRRIEMRLSALMELINDLLALAAAKTVEPDQPLDRVLLETVIQEVVDRLSTEAQDKHLTLTLKTSQKGLAVRATEDGLDSVFTNLVANAIKYTPSGGSVQVRVDKEQDRVKITISDTGIGIPKEAMPRIWDEFFRAPNARRSGIAGTGLGLSIVRQHVVRFGGVIEVSSTPGEGTTFTLTLPLDEKGGRELVDHGCVSFFW